ncbi:MAG: type III-B CRISPR module-associated protein Cmr5 [Chromatiaceae bacterium]
MATTSEQKRAQHAWRKAQEGVSHHGKDYVNDAKGLPALIMNSGLMQVMAFLHGKGGRHALLGQHLRDWLHEHANTPKDFEGFMQHLVEMDDARRFQAITTEAFAWLKWLRQMAPACLKES